ncbi:hypothetical protein DFH07DRAFT_867075 [Mycena maculata]|uniref:Uncharacterized protein n=1 Tax=Mycena maculata TaxID=230809 RepID=A0AAD7NKU8_9AGAR|nr:hypothetical protein DFH07DRAFT_867075 [Mycena maculata]
MRVFLWILSEGGAQDVQETLHKKGGVSTVPWTSSQGSVFYLNDLWVIIAKDYANPLTRANLHFYLEIPDGPISEAWHAQKWWREIDRDALTPMIVHGTCHFYVDELARCRNGDLVIPLHWVIYKGAMHADAFKVHVNDQCRTTVDESKEIFIAAVDLINNYFDLEHQKALPILWNEPYAMKMPNPLRKLANGRPLYTSLQEFHTHFITISPHASPSEQFEGIKHQIESTHTALVVVYDRNTQEEAAFRLFINTGPSDNPMSSEMTGYIGSKGNYFCRKCHVGGCGLHKESNEGFDSMFGEGLPRTGAETLKELHKQVELACLGVAQAVKDIQTNTGVKDAYTTYWIKDLLQRSRELRKGNPNLDSADIVKELMDWVTENESKIYNPFLSMKGFDPAKDMPIEILHTILLGIVKYAWHKAHTAWSPAKKVIYTHHLQATNTLGLSIPAIRAGYIMQFANSLIGHQFKQVTQTCVFQMHDLVDEFQYTAWKAMGELLPLLWYPEIDKLEQYLQNHFKEQAPHTGSHNSRCHGPLVGNATEGFESFNGIFCFCSIFSNHLAPSRDIARQLAQQEGLKHRLMGGWWMDVSSGEWERAGSAVRDFLSAKPILQALLGWTDPKPSIQGTHFAMLLSFCSFKFDLFRICETSAIEENKGASNSTPCQIEPGCNSCINVVSASRDVYAKSPITNLPVIGRIVHILSGADDSVVVLDVFEVSNQRHEIYNLPKLFRRQDEETLLIVPSKNIQFIFNIQHDCYAANCTASGTRPKMQERMESPRTESFIEHQALDKFVINTTAFHNAHLLRRCLPRLAWAPSGKQAKRKTAAANAAADPNVKTKKRKAPTQKAAPKKKRQKTRSAAVDGAKSEVDDFELINSSESERESDSEGEGDPDDTDEKDSDESEDEVYIRRPTRRPRGQGH